MTIDFYEIAVLLFALTCTAIVFCRLKKAEKAMITLKKDLQKKIVFNDIGELSEYVQAYFWPKRFFTEQQLMMALEMYRDSSADGDVQVWWGENAHRIQQNAPRSNSDEVK